MDARWLRTFALIAEAEMPTRVYIQSVSGATQKAVLWTVFAHEGTRMSFQAIADRSGCCMVTAWRTVRLLVQMGVVEERRTSKKRSAAFFVNPEPLASAVCTTPMCKTA
jgi:hypothetical protein